ncbi:MAG: ATP synthase subunit C [Treponema sp.]|jgi:V/A-type H+-transporting ATPase subunit K|nr:ATP synthase subunit C [Treponema sp.]
MKKFVLILLIMLVSAAVFAQENGSAEENSELTYAGVLKYFAAALAVGISCIAGGHAVAKIGTAAMGAMSENADLSGKAIPYAGLAEGICLWGFLIGLLILFL